MGARKSFASRKASRSRSSSILRSIQFGRTRIAELTPVLVFFLILSASHLIGFAANTQAHISTSSSFIPKYEIYREKFTVNTTAYSGIINLGVGMYLFNFSASVQFIPRSQVIPHVNFSWSPTGFGFARFSSKRIMIITFVYQYVSPLIISTTLSVIENSGWSNITAYNDATVPVRVLSFLDSKHGQFFETISHVGILTKGGPIFTVSDTLRGAIPRIVLANYYPWYSPSAWTASGRNCTGCSAATGVPTFGFYKSQDTTLIHNQIILAKNHNLTGFLSEWGGDDNYATTANKLLFQEAQKLGFKVTVYYESTALLGLSPSKAQAKFVNASEYILKTFGTSSEMLKIRGIPVIFLFYADGFSPVFWQVAISKIRAVHPSVYFIGDSFNCTYYDVFDGLSHYSVNFNSIISGTGLTNGTLTTYYDMEIEANLHNRLWFGPIMPGFDNVNDRLEPLTYSPRHNGNTYIKSWTYAVRSAPDGVTIASWNEWHEGTNIEPLNTNKPMPDYWAINSQYLDLTAIMSTQFILDGTVDSLNV